MEHGDVERTATIELEEETGLKAGELIEIGSFAVAPGHNTQMCYAFLASKLTEGKQKLETSEKGMQLKKVSQKELETMINQGEIIDGLTITSFKLFELYLVSRHKESK